MKKILSFVTDGLVLISKKLSEVSARMNSNKELAKLIASWQ